MRILLRLKLDGAKVLEIDPQTIRSFRIDYCEDSPDYFFSMSNDSQEYVVCVGNFDQCHAMLNKIHNILDVKLIDI